MSTSSDWSCAGIIFGPDAHYLDHLLPLCHFMEIPLIVTEESIEQSAKKFYPKMQVVRIDPLSLPEYVIHHFDILFCCTPRILFDEIFFFAQKLHNKKIHTIWCPHGNSDKGHASYFMEALSHETVALIYGEKMIDFLAQKGAFSQLKAHVLTGNFRLQYHHAHRSFFDSILEKEVMRRLPPAQKTLLFAPTWNDYERSSSFHLAMSPLADRLPADWNLIVKLHPNLLLENEGKVDRIISDLESHPRILFLKDFPPVYPLLQYVDLYIGDMSSIGYDFLALNKPMFFLNPNARDAKTDPGLYLFRCGVEIPSEHSLKIYEIIKNHLDKDSAEFSKIRKEVYQYTFGKEKSLETLKTEIENTYRVFPEKDLNFF